MFKKNEIIEAAQTEVNRAKAHTQHLIDEGIFKEDSDYVKFPREKEALMQQMIDMYESENWEQTEELDELYFDNYDQGDTKFRFFDRVLEQYGIKFDIAE